jgi:uncharacterized protein (TIGR02246 family)
MMPRFVSSISITIILAFAGCADRNDGSGESTMTKQNEDIEAIKELAETWRSGWLAGDADLLLSLYADEPVLMPQDQPVVAGKGAIRPLYEAVLKEFDFQSEGTVKEVVVSGDMGYFWSAYTLTATPKAGGEPMKVTGKSIFIVRREPGGAWKIARLMDNRDGVTTGQDKPQKGEPDGAANGSQPIRSQTNSTSSAAGPRR